MNDTEDLGPNFFQHVPNVPEIKDLSPGSFDGGDVGAGPPGHVNHPLTKHAVNADDHLVAGLDQVNDAGLHAGAAGATDRKGENIPRAEESPEHVLSLVHDLQKLW